MNTPVNDIWSTMTDMQDLPPDAEDASPATQSSPQAPGIEYRQLPLTPPTASDEGTPAEDNPLQSAFKTAGIRGLLPTALAKEERTARLNESRNRRRNGETLTADEIRDDLSKILAHLITQFSTHTAGVSIILKLPAQALLYAERTASYALSDYPRSFENDIVIAGLWDALERIYLAAADWRKDPNKGDGRAVIGSIDRIAKAAIRGLYTAPDAPSHDKEPPAETDLE